MIERFNDLKVWQKSHSLVLDVYKITESFPKKESYILTSQLLRAVISVPANIAEGKGRTHITEYIQCLNTSSGSLEETKYFLLLAKYLGYSNEDVYKKLKCKCDEIGKMLYSLINSLKRNKK